jgi:hypothetical protein
MVTIDRGGYKRKATDSFKRVDDESPRYTRATPGNQLVFYKARFATETFTERAATAILLWTSISEVFGSNVSRDDGYPD